MDLQELNTNFEASIKNITEIITNIRKNTLSVCAEK